MVCKAHGVKMCRTCESVVSPLVEYRQADEEDLPPGVMKCKGINGTIRFDGTWVTIDRSKGILARSTVGKRVARGPKGDDPMKRLRVE